jgi:beta propeller repeat protein
MKGKGAARGRWLLAAASTGLAAGFALAAPVSAAATSRTFQSAETRITWDPANQYDPAISGHLIVYTGDTGALGTDIFVYDRDTGAEVAVTNQNGKQQLSDVSGNLIAYTDFAPPIVNGVRSASDVLVYDVTTGLPQNLTADSTAAAGNPAIDGSLVAWEDRRDGNLEIYAKDLSTGEVRRVSNGTSDDTNPDVSDGTVVWEHREGMQRDIWFYRWADGSTGALAATPDDEISPAIAGHTVVYQKVEGNDQDIYAYNTTTGAVRRLALPGVQRNPNVSGSTVTFEDLSTGVSHVFAWDLAATGTDSVAYLTGGASAQFLNDIDGNAVVYTDDRGVQQDIYLTQFTWTSADTTPPVLTLPAPATVTATSSAGAAVSYTASATDDTDGDVPTPCSPASGSTFPLGTTPVACTATDAAGNTAFGQFPVTVTYAWSGALQPANADGSSIFKAGSTVPVKFTLTGASAGITDATATLSYAKVSNQIEGDILEAVTNVGGSTGSQFRYDPTAGQYIFNWSTKGLTAGTYSIKIDLGDSAVHALRISLK